MDIVNLIISLISGAVGGNLGGAAVSEKSLGTLANTVIGLLGGGAGDWILRLLGVLSSAGAAGATATTGSPDLDIASILASVGVSGATGGILTAAIALIKNAMEKNSR